jgi:hypothetical protein
VQLTDLCLCVCTVSNLRAVSVFVIFKYKKKTFRHVHGLSTFGTSLAFLIHAVFCTEEVKVYADLVKKFFGVYGARRSITVFTSAAIGPCPEPDESSPHPVLVRRGSPHKSWQLFLLPKMWQLGKWSVYVCKHVAFTCKRYRQMGYRYRSHWKEASKPHAF